MIHLTKTQRQENELSEAAQRYGEQRFEEFAKAKGYSFNTEDSGYGLCVVRRNRKRSICEVLPVWRLSDKNNRKAVLSGGPKEEDRVWVEFGWLISLKGIIRYRPRKSNFRVYPLPLAVHC